MNFIAKPVKFLKEVKIQLSKVSWPRKEELITATAVVIVITAILTVFVGMVDLIFSRILSWIFR